MSYSRAASIYPIKKIYKMTKSDTTMLDPSPRAVNCGTAGTCTFWDGDGNLCTDYPLQQGYNPIEMTKLLTGGTADDIWALC